MRTWLRGLETADVEEMLRALTGLTNGVVVVSVLVKTTPGDLLHGMAHTTPRLHCDTRVL